MCKKCELATPSLSGVNYSKIYLMISIVMLRNSYTSGDHVDTHRLEKRMDLESCLGRFDVHKDTIIRTEESQSIGGKFLQGVGLETLEECQRLCCESEGCDVFIFEEKGEGYCYLFECGPPENFHCKFTRHANYTSAVLTPIRHVTPPATPKPQLPSQGQLQINSLSQNELELTNLKTKVELNTPQRKTTTTILPPLGVRVGDQVVTTKSTVVNPHKCGRFQFQCHSGECIAVYNACDGIPQCEDGSDEGPECPASSSAAKTSIDNKNLDMAAVSAQQAVQMAQPDVMMPVSKQTGQAIPRSYQEQTVQIPVINNREDPLSSPNWQAHKIPAVQQDLDQNSHIFSHKGGLQIQSNGMAQFPNVQTNAMYNQMQREMYIQPEMQDLYRSPLIQPQDHLVGSPNINWPQQQIPQQPQQMIPVQQQFIAPETNDQAAMLMKQRPVTQQHLIQQAEHTAVLANPVPPVSAIQPSPPAPPPDTNSKSKSEEGSKHSHHSHSHQSEESEEYEDEEDKSTEPPKKKPKKHHKQKEAKEKSRKLEPKAEPVLENPVHEQYKMIKNDLEMEFVDHDGQSERPGGAVLSLSLGIIVTAALAVLVGCRMRTVGRRVRRNGKTPYAHDADFLVNGMYL